MHIYGSNFYQKYMNGSEQYRRNFERVIKKKLTKYCFILNKLKKIFYKKYQNQIRSLWGMGVSEEWSDYEIKESKNECKICFLSARALYKYINIENLVDAFIDVYGNNEKYELWLVNGYGWDNDVKERVKLKIKNQSNIIDLIGEWINDKQLKEIYDQSDYNFCIGDTDQLSVSILYGYL